MRQRICSTLFVVTLLVPVAWAIDSVLPAFVLDASQPRTELLKTSAVLAEPEITEGAFDFVPSSEMRKVRVVLFNFEKDMTTTQVLKEMDGRGYRPITFQELLWVSIKYPKEQVKYTIVALGSVVKIKGVERIAFLTALDNKPLLGTAPYITGDNAYLAWSATYRFGAVKTF